MIEPSENFNDITTEMMRQAREYCQRFIAPIAAEIDQKNLIDREIWRSMGQMGFLGVSIEQRLGGGGMGYLEHCLLVEELTKASPGVALSYLNHTSSCIDLIRIYGNDTQKRLFLPRLLKGELIGATATYEGGSSVLQPQINCLAELTNGRFVINGEKAWVVNGSDADIFVMFIHTDNPQYKNSLSAVIVPGDTRGLVRGPRLQTTGVRGSGICNISLKNCSVPVENTLGNINGGNGMLIDSNIRESIAYAAAPLGLVQSVLNLIIARLGERQAMESASVTQSMGNVADIYARYRSYQAFVHKLATNLQENKLTRYEAQAGPYLTAKLAVEAVRVALDLTELRNYLLNDTLARFERDASFYTVGVYNRGERQEAMIRGILEMNQDLASIYAEPPDDEQPDASNKDDGDDN